MTAREKHSARASAPNDALTAKVRRALKSGRKLRRDADGWLVDAKTGELIGPDPRIERPLTKAQLGKATVRQSGRTSISIAAKLKRTAGAVDVRLSFLRRAAHGPGAKPTRDNRDRS